MHSISKLRGWYQFGDIPWEADDILDASQPQIRDDQTVSRKPSDLSNILGATAFNAHALATSTATTTWTVKTCAGALYKRIPQPTRARCSAFCKCIQVRTCYAPGPGHDRFEQSYNRIDGFRSTSRSTFCRTTKFRLHGDVNP